MLGCTHLLVSYTHYARVLDEVKQEDMYRLRVEHNLFTLTGGEPIGGLSAKIGAKNRPAANHADYFTMHRWMNRIMGP